MKKILIIFSVVLGISTAKAQDIENFLVLGSDANQLMESYLQPAFEGTIYNLNGGWYRTAKTHKLLGFDLTLNASFASVPDARQTFNFIPSGNLSLKSGNSSTALPTVFGGTTDEVFVFTQNFDANGNPDPDGAFSGEFEFDAFDGLGEELDEVGANVVPSAMIQAGIGLPFKTDVTIRLVPKQETSDFSTDLFGFGIKHNILQHFPFADKIPLVDVSAFFGYTKMNASYFPGANQSIDFETTATTAQLIGSVDLKIINFYLGLGYTGGSADMSVNGSYVYEFKDTNGNVIGSKPIDQADLPSLSYDVSGFKTTIGASLNLFIFKIFADYTLQEYNAFNFGFAVSVR